MQPACRTKCLGCCVPFPCSREQCSLHSNSFNIFCRPHLSLSASFAGRYVWYATWLWWWLWLLLMMKCHMLHTAYLHTFKTGVPRAGEHVMPAARGGSKGGHIAGSKRGKRNSRRELEPASTHGSGQIHLFYDMGCFFFLIVVSWTLAWRTPESGNALHMPVGQTDRHGYHGSISNSNNLSLIHI